MAECARAPLFLFYITISPMSQYCTLREAGISQVQYTIGT
jgi:hypothetical protein